MKKGKITLSIIVLIILLGVSGLLVKPIINGIHKRGKCTLI